MKNYVIGLLFLGLTNLVFSQSEIAYTDLSLEIGIETSKKDHINLSFINSFTSVDISERILSFQNLAANYDIKTNSVYTPNKPATYTVHFKEANNKIENQYNQSGEILKSNQSYSSIRLPYTISYKIAKEHPGWSINGIKCTIIYTKGDPIDVSYKVKLKNGSSTKTLKI